MSSRDKPNSFSRPVRPPDTRPSHSRLSPTSRRSEAPPRATWPPRETARPTGERVRPSKKRNVGNLAFFYDTFFSALGRVVRLSPAPVHFAYGGMRQVPPTGVSLTLPASVPTTRSRSWLSSPALYLNPLRRAYEYVYCIARRPPDAKRGERTMLVARAESRVLNRAMMR